MKSNLKFLKNELTDDPVFERSDAVFSFVLDLLNDSFNLLFYRRKHTPYCREYSNVFTNYRDQPQIYGHFHQSHS